MDHTLIEIESYLKETKEWIKNDRYIIELNHKRKGNKDLFLDCVVD